MTSSFEEMAVIVLPIIGDPQGIQHRNVYMEEYGGDVSELNPFR